MQAAVAAQDAVQDTEDVVAVSVFRGNTDMHGYLEARIPLYTEALIPLRDAQGWVILPVSV